jgi:hypothetical protein
MDHVPSLSKEAGREWIRSTPTCQPSIQPCRVKPVANMAEI